MHTIYFCLQTCYTTINPEWEEAFTFFIQDPRKQDIDIQVTAHEINLNFASGILVA